jgi:hypothetical protein
MEGETQKYRVGQDHIYTVYIRYFWQKTHHTYVHIRCIYTVLANPTKIPCQKYVSGSQRVGKLQLHCRPYGRQKRCRSEGGAGGVRRKTIVGFVGQGHVFTVYI